MANNDEFQQQRSTGTNGQWTEQDLKDMMEDLLKEQESSKIQWVAICYADENGNSKFMDMFHKAMVKEAKKYTDGKQDI